MLNAEPYKIRYERWFWAFIVIHLLVWTLTPSIIRLNLPMDAIEGALWGQHLEWGYDKNPFLNGWLTALAVHGNPHAGWMTYAFSQLSVVICFWATWQLAKKILKPVHALLSVVLLEGIQYYNLHAIDFNDNTLELSLWALTILCFYNALQHNTRRDWILTGLSAGLGMMAKYYTAMLLLPMLCLMLVTSQYRAYFRTSALYWGIAMAVVIVLPHSIWLCLHKFVTLDYAVHRVSAIPSALNHISFPLQFTWQQAEALIPAFTLSLFLLLGHGPLRLQPPYKISTENWRFLLFVGLGPLLATILLSSLLGMRLRAGWGQPLLSLVGILYLAWLQPLETRRRFYRFMLILYFVLLATASSYAIQLLRAPHPSSANFPGEIIAESLTQEWVARYHTPLHFVAGSRWVGGNIAFYSSAHPAVWINWDKQKSPWIDEKALNRDGAIFVWDMSEDQEKFPRDILPLYPRLTMFEVRHYPWLRNPKQKPVAVGVAFLPPAST